MIIMQILQYGWNGYGILNLFTLVIMSITYYKMVGMAILQNGFIQNGIVKMVKMENGQLS